MLPTTIIVLGVIIVILSIISITALVLTSSTRRYIWGISIAILLICILFFSMRPVIIESQTDNAIVELNAYLDINYPEESWEITHTDDYNIKSSKELHVIFENESDIVYSYLVKKDSVEQIDFWGYTSGESSEKLMAKGINPIHLE